MTTQAKVVIIGGGVMGCSLAYHLCKEGWTDVVLLEKAELTSGSTWHAAGQITHSVSHYGLAKMAAYGTELYPRLEAETGHSCSWHGCGSPPPTCAASDLNPAGRSCGTASRRPR